MPQEKKKRGRREERKRKIQENDDEDPWLKRQKLTFDIWEQDEIKLEEAPEQHLDDSLASVSPDTRGGHEFYGFLDETEQAYFKRAYQMLELNQFATEEERQMFLANVWNECNDKELKIACSQSCSRLLEKLIQLSTTHQLKRLFHKFSDHLIPLVQHRFASHCCEALFLRSAPIVTEELATPFEIVNTENEEEHASMETLFLRVFKELDSSMGYLMTDNFASHTVRVLLLVLSGRPLHDHSTQALLQSKRKENINFSTKDTRTQDGAKTARAVPESFQGALNEIINGMVGNLDANYLRTLALQPQGNPVLQLLLELEFTLSGKQKAKDENSLFRKLVPELPPEEGTVGSQFICGLLYDSVGSHLLETIIQCSPGRVFKAIYNSQLRPKLNSILKNESASYVLLKALERLGPEDLEDAIGQLLPDIPMLLDRSKTAIIRAVIERCQVRHIDFEKLDTTLRTYYGEISQSTINSLLNLPKDDWHNMSAARRGQIETQSTARLHASLLAQTMLDSPGALRDFVLEALLIADQEDIVTAAKDKHATFVFQRSLAPTSENQKFRRKLLQKITSRFTEIALDSIGSHAFNVFWTATHDLTFIRERAAQELADCEVQIKNSFSGRIVWRNWMMDLFIRNRKTWIQRSKESDIPQSISSGKTVDNEPKKKRAIELAMERFAVNKASQSRTRSRVKMG